MTEREIRILHVDDEPDFGELTATYLQREDDDFTVVTVTSADEALDRLTEGSDFDAIVSDYDMPWTNGIELLSAVREIRPAVPFVLFTGKGSEEIAGDAISAGVTDYLQKRASPDHYRLLANRIRNAVESYRTRRALEERTEQLETLVDNLPGMVYRCANERGWPMENVEGECERLTGYTPEELESGAVIWGEEILHPEDRDDMWSVVQDALDSGNSFEVTYRVVTRDGTEKWMWERGRGIYDGDELVALEGFITDITRRKRMEDRFKALFENNPDPIVAVTYDEGEPIVVEANAAFERVFGYERDAARGESINELIVPEAEKFESEEVDTLARSGEAVTREVTRQTKDGTLRRFLFQVAHTEETGTRRVFYGIYRDIADLERYVGDD